MKTFLLPFLLLLSLTAMAEKPVCDPQIRLKICSLPSVPNTWPDVPTLNCGPTDEDIISQLEKISAEFPETLQKVFCSLDNILIIEESGGSAFGGYAQDRNGKFHSMLGINKNVFEQGAILADWASWKEQLSFGGSQEPVNYNNSLPVITTNNLNVSNEFLYFVLAHEMGHILDYANKVVRFKAKKHCGKKEECEIDQTSFAGFSWKTSKKLKSELVFPERAGLCFYRCSENYLDWSASIYDNAFKSGFISLYGAYNVRDDFAEAVAYYALLQLEDPEYVLTTPEQRNFFPLQEFKRGILLKKYKFIEDLFNRADLNYGNSSGN